MRHRAKHARPPYPPAFATFATFAGRDTSQRPVRVCSDATDRVPLGGGWGAGLLPRNRLIDASEQKANHLAYGGTRFSEMIAFCATVPPVPRA